jgi:nucleoside-diphosphate-sugar epimerase
MIVGSGLIARAFLHGGANAWGDTCFYAAGVSNSGCKDEREYLRERTRLDAAMAECSPSDRFVYFSTCSIEDPAMRDSEYVQHKIGMENHVRERTRHLILRLPQVAGSTPNPHTLLNYLHARIARSERFHIWSGATRNIIDVEDVVKIAMDLIATEGANAETINIANPRSTMMLDIVRAMERTLDTRAIFDMLDKGSGATIDIGRISASIRRCGITFSDAYLGDIIEKYYGECCYEMELFPACLGSFPTVFHRPGWQL